MCKFAHIVKAFILPALWELYKLTYNCLLFLTTLRWLSSLAFYLQVQTYRQFLDSLKWRTSSFSRLPYNFCSHLKAIFHPNPARKQHLSATCTGGWSHTPNSVFQSQSLVFVSQCLKIPATFACMHVFSSTYFNLFPFFFAWLRVAVCTYCTVYTTVCGRAVITPVQLWWKACACRLIRYCVCVRVCVGGESGLKCDLWSDVLNKAPSPHLPLGSDIPSVSSHSEQRFSHQRSWSSVAHNTGVTSGESWWSTWGGGSIHCALMEEMKGIKRTGATFISDLVETAHV